MLIDIFSAIDLDYFIQSPDVEKYVDNLRSVMKKLQEFFLTFWRREYLREHFDISWQSVDIDIIPSGLVKRGLRDNPLLYLL